VIQRDLTQEPETANGKFRMNMQTFTHGAGGTGLIGTISFRASESAPDADAIRLTQAVRVEDIGVTGKDVVWTGNQAPRSQMQTTEDTKRGVQPGFFLDHDASAQGARTSKSDPAVPHHYTHWQPIGGQTGSKHGKHVVPARLDDNPHAPGLTRFTFETVAEVAGSQLQLASLHWGFTAHDALQTTSDEWANAHTSGSATFDAALQKFNEFYKNPGTPGAPQ
jgi:hypothetical protein